VVNEQRPDPDPDPVESPEDIDPDTVIEDAIKFFGDEGDTGDAVGSPASDADAPAPPG
jgi:hypothetical protein